MPDITPPDPSGSLHGPHSPRNLHPSAAAEPTDWAEVFQSGPGKVWAIPDGPTITVNDDEWAALAKVRLSEGQLAEVDEVVELCAQTYEEVVFFGGAIIATAYRLAWAAVRPLIEQRLCDCPRDPYHRWNCPATPIWAQTIRDLDTNPWTVVRDELIRARSDFFDAMVDGGWPE